MALVRLPFQPRWRSLVLSGEKSTTVRTKLYGEAGDVFELEGARFLLLEVVQVSLAEARDRWWREEGMTGPEEFEGVWTENHPQRGFRASDAVWVHRFARQ